MSKTLYRAVLHLHAEVCQDGIDRIRLVGPEQAFAAQDIDVMAVLCTAFSQQQIVVAVFLVDMWPLRIPAAKTSPQMMNLAKPFAALHIDLTYLDITFLPKEIALIVLEVEGGVAAADGKVDHDGFRPLASGIVSPHIEMPSRRKDCCHHIEPPVMVADGRCIDAAVAVSAFQVHLRGPRQAVAYLFPVHQVFRIEYWYTREVLERAVHQIEVVACPAYARVGMESRQYGILESLGAGHRCEQRQ